ncbi:MAG: DUF2007 domain-containing protein [Dehalococcoidia bacterium]|nr:DUF2007 domain-containing protein [Dehalococcoidia bacterium]
MSAKEQLITICTARQMEAQIIQGRLQSEGIPALLSYESLGLVYGFTTDGLGDVRIMVPEHLVKEAEEILANKAVSNAKLQSQAHDKPTWFKPLCLALLIAWIVIGGGR